MKSARPELGIGVLGDPVERPDEAIVDALLEDFVGEGRRGSEHARLDVVVALVVAAGGEGVLSSSEIDSSTTGLCSPRGVS